MADGAAFCPNCGQAFAAAAAAPRTPMAGAAISAPMGGGGAAISTYAGYAAVPRVEYAGFWVRFLAWLIDNVVMGVGVVLILIPLIFLTGLRTVLDDFHPNEDMNDAGVFMLIGFVFVLATASLVVTDMAGQRVSFGRATGRHFAKIVTNLASFGIGLGYLMAAFTEKKQALHDMLAGCLVLRRDS